MEECALQVNIHNIFQLKPRTKKKRKKRNEEWIQLVIQQNKKSSSAFVNKWKDTKEEVNRLNYCRKTSLDEIKSAVGCRN